VSTYVYLACLDHSPPLVADEESTQHRYNDDEMRLVREWVRDRGDLVEAWQNGLVQYRGVSDSSASYFAVNTARFLVGHLTCRLAARDEYGRWIDLGQGLPDDAKEDA
jgi:hypothetical protein